MNVIEIHDVWKTFRVYFDKGSSLKEKALFHNRSRYENRTVLKGVDFSVAKGEAVGLIGRNGCGKSTLLKLLSRIMYPDQGTIEVQGRVSSLIELGAGFHPDMSGRENIYTNASIFGLTQHEIDARLQQIIDFSELHDYIDNPVRTYSSGMYMRLAFSVAINVDADVLLIDEILAVGDAAFQAKCFKKLKEIKARGTTIVIVSHSLGQIEEFCERSIWIEQGKVRMIGTPSQVHPCYLDYMNGGSGEPVAEGQEDPVAPQSQPEQVQDMDTKSDAQESRQEDCFLQRFHENTVSLYPQVPTVSTESWKEQLLKPVMGRVRAMVSPPFEQQGSVNALLAEGIEELLRKIGGLEANLNQIQTAVTQLDGSRNYFSEIAARHSYELEEIKKNLEPLCQQGQYVTETLGSQNFRLTEAEKKLEELQNQGQYNSETLGSQNFRLTEAEKRLEGLQSQGQYNSETLESQNFRLTEAEKKLEGLQSQGQYNSETLESQNFRLTEAEKKLEGLQSQGQYNSETLESQNFRLTETEKKLGELQNQGQYNSETLIELNYQLQQAKWAIENFRYQAGGSGSHYAQSGEDAVVEYIVDRLQIPLSEVTYLDLGANHAKYLSNTNYFYEHGARGVLVEANPQLIEELTTQRPNDIVLNRCITTKSGEKIPFYILSGDGLSSCDRDAVDKTLEENPEIKIEKTVDVETITVQDILKQYFKKPPVLVNVDIEGMELDVLKGFDLDHCRPLIFIVETIPYRTKLVVGEKEETVLDFMKSKGYVEYAFTGINSILIDTSQLENR